VGGGAVIGDKETGQVIFVRKDVQDWIKAHQGFPLTRKGVLTNLQTDCVVCLMSVRSSVGESKENRVTKKKGKTAAGACKINI